MSRPRSNVPASGLVVLPLLLLPAMVTGCVVAPPPPIYVYRTPHHPHRHVVARARATMRTARHEVCAAPVALSGVDKDRLFRQFDHWRAAHASDADAEVTASPAVSRPCATSS